MSNEKLALLGGEPEVTIPQPHFQWPECGPDEEAAVLDVMRRGELSYYRRSGVVEEFENAFAALVGLPYAISSHSGTGALHAAYFALNLPLGSEVIVPAYTHLATAMPMLHVGLVPVLCDIDMETGNIDPADAERQVTGRTRAIAVTPQYGHNCAMPEITALAKRHNLRVIADCSHAHGATCDERHVGVDTDVACFSLQAHKTVWGGEGGILLTADPGIAERAALLAHFRERREFTSEALAPYVETGFGLKHRLHPLAAALALVQLRKMPETVRVREENYQYFVNRMAAVPGIRVPPTAANVTRGGFFRFLVFYEAGQLGDLPMEKYVEALVAEGASEVKLGSLVRPLHSYKLFQTADHPIYSSHIDGQPLRSTLRVYRQGDFPKAERFAATTLQFPPFADRGRDLIDAYAKAMEKVARNVEALLAC